LTNGEVKPDTKKGLEEVVAE
jgi:hypothetical protein